MVHLKTIIGAGVLALALAACSQSDEQINVNPASEKLEIETFSVAYPDFMEEDSQNGDSPMDKSVFALEGSRLDAAVRIASFDHGISAPTQDPNKDTYGFEVKSDYEKAGYTFIEMDAIETKTGPIIHYKAVNDERQEDWYWYEPRKGVAYEITIFVEDDAETKEFEPTSAAAEKVRKLVIDSFEIKKDADKVHPLLTKG